MVPAVFTTVDALPLTGSGKLDRKALPTRNRACDAGRPPTPTEQALAGIWSTLLNHPPTTSPAGQLLHPRRSSLLSTQLISRIRDVFEVEVSIRQLFVQPTLSGLAAVIDRLQADGGLDDAALATSTPGSRACPRRRSTGCCPRAADK